MRSSWTGCIILPGVFGCSDHSWGVVTCDHLRRRRLDQHLCQSVCPRTLNVKTLKRRKNAGDSITNQSSSGAATPSFLPFITFSTMLFIDPDFIERFLWLVCDGTGACLELRWVLVYPLLNQSWWRDRSKDSETDGQRQLEFVALDGLLKVWHATLRAAQDLSAFCRSSWQLTQVGSSSLHFHISCTKMLLQRWTLLSSSRYFFGFISSKTADEIMPEVLMC